MILGGVNWEYWEVVMIVVIYTKQIIYLSGQVDETSFFARGRLILVLG